MKNRILLAVAIVLFSLSPLQWTSGQPNVVSPPGALSFSMPVSFQQATTFNSASTFNGGLTVPLGQTLTVNGTCSGCGPNVFNVQNYGAKGDGVTNDAAAIQAALTAAASGGVAYFPNGTYHLAGAGCALLVGANGTDTAIIGQSRKATILDGTSCPNSITLLLSVPTGQDLTIRNITVKCGPTNTGTIGLHTQNNGTTFLQDMAIDSCSQYALELESTYVNITGSTFNLINPGVGSPVGIIVISGSRGTIENIYTSGIYVGNAGDNEIKNYHITRSLLDDHTPGAIWVDGAQTHDITVDDCIIYTNTNGIGIKVGEVGHSPTRVIFSNDLVGPFSTGYAELWNIQIIAGVTDTVFSNVTTQVQNGGGDISDAGTNTRFFNVTTSGTFAGTGGTYNWIHQGTAVMGVTEVTGSGAGNYTTVSTTYFNVPNLVVQSATVPTGWKDDCRATASVDTNSLGATLNVAIADGGTVKREQTMMQAVASDFTPVTVSYVVPGDDLAHTLTVQWKVSAGTATMANSTATLTPNLICSLTPSQ